MSTAPEKNLHGLMAEFADVDGFVTAAREAHAAGFEVEAYSPFAVEGLPQAIGFTSNKVAPMTLIGGIGGGIGGYALQWYSAVIDYPLNIGGRPLHSWPAFIPISFETAILGAALAAVFGMLLANGLPRLRHPIFEVPEFDLVTRDRFFLVLHTPAQAELARARQLLETMPAQRVCEVPR
jgi:hypothetical protein